MIIFTSRHKSINYYSVVNLNFLFIVILFSIKITKISHYWYVFNICEKYNKFLYNILNSRLTMKPNYYYVYIFDIIFFIIYILYESSIFFKFFSTFTNFYFFVPSIVNSDLTSTVLLNFFVLTINVKLVFAYLILTLDWDLFLNSYLFLNSSLLWNFHIFFLFMYIINLEFSQTLVNGINYVTTTTFSNFLKNLNAELNLIWILADNIFTINNNQIIFKKDFLYFVFIFILIFFFAVKLI